MGMDVEHEQRHSFVVTIWREDAPAESPNRGWRGHITHVQSGERRYLRKLQEIVTFVGAHVGSLDRSNRRKGLLAPWRARSRSRPVINQSRDDGD
jgi:hypothetical protein